MWSTWTAGELPVLEFCLRVRQQKTDRLEEKQSKIAKNTKTIRNLQHCLLVCQNKQLLGSEPCACCNSESTSGRGESVQKSWQFHLGKAPNVPVAENRRWHGNLWNANKGYQVAKEQTISKIGKWLNFNRLSGHAGQMGRGNVEDKI